MEVLRLKCKGYVPEYCEGVCGRLRSKCDDILMPSISKELYPNLDSKPVNSSFVS